MADTPTDQYLAHNQQYAGGQAVRKPSHPGKQDKQTGTQLNVGLITFFRGARSILESSRLPDAIKYVGWCVLLLLPTSFVGKGLNWALTIGNAGVALAIVGFAAVLLLLFAALMTNEQFLRDVQLQGIRWPSVLSITLGWLAVMVFGGLSCGFERIGIVELQPSVPFAEGCATRYADFYLWHLFDSIPGIKFNETVGWTQRYVYSDKLSGWLLLAFKVLVVVSIIGSFVVTGRLRRENETTVSSKDGRAN